MKYYCLDELGGELPAHGEVTKQSEIAGLLAAQVL
jgi:hypothetical protein